MLKLLRARIVELEAFTTEELTNMLVSLSQGYVTLRINEHDRREIGLIEYILELRFPQESKHHE